MNRPLWSGLIAWIAVTGFAPAQPLGEPDQGSPGDAMIQAYLRNRARDVEARLNEDLGSRAQWEARRPGYEKEFLHMLGLDPLPERTPLNATVTGRLSGDGYVVEMLHYQSRPGLYVTGNLYKPATVREGERLPAVFYVCGHSGRGRHGNKVAYQSHGIWFARHGYVCLVVDTLQLGEIAAVHHGTYNLGRWSWHSRGYTPAGVEAWNGIRGIDYLTNRPDVDGTRIAVTGISGGGAATFWIAAADPRVTVAVPVSGMADLESYVSNRVINGHCDCMFLHNTFGWPWTRIAGLIAPRPLLFVNSDADPIFPMDANERVIHRLERLYSLYGAGDDVDAVVSVGGHAYREDIRKAAYRFIQSRLRGDPGAVADSERDIVSEGANPGPYPIPPERLRVFPTDADLPADQVNTTIDEHFVPIATVNVPASGQFPDWRKQMLQEVKRLSFGYFPNTIPAAERLGEVEPNHFRLQTEPGIEVHLRLDQDVRDLNQAREILVAVLNQEEAGSRPDWVRGVATAGQAIVYCEPRGIGATRWTMRNPPNYIERSHVLLGQTVDEGRVWDVIAAARYLRGSTASPSAVTVAGRGAAAVLAGYAVALDETLQGAVLVSPVTSHLDNRAPQFLSILRTCDVPEGLALIAPRPLRIMESDADAFAKTAQVYRNAGAGDRISWK